MRYVKSVGVKTVRLAETPISAGSRRVHARQ